MPDNSERDSEGPTINPIDNRERGCDLVEERLDLEGVLDRLSPAERRVICNVCNGKEVEEIAHACRVTRNAVSKCLHRGVLRLRRFLADT